MSDRQYPLSGASNSRGVRFLGDGPLVPLDLVRARDAGEVVFIVGAGVSRGSGLPLFQELTRDVYRQLTGDDPAMGGAIPHAEKKAYDGWSFDVALGLLEERYDGDAVNAAAPSRRVREAVAQALDAGRAADLERHRHLLMLGRDARMRPRLITTNFDLLFEHAWPTVCGASLPLQSRANTNLPQPGDHDFYGVLHLHGRLGDPRFTPPLPETELVLTSADFGEAYLRDGWAARFLYDLVRRYHLVLVGYGAEDPPLKYLLSVIAAHRRRFTDLKTLYAFAGAASGEGDAVAAEWLAKGIMPLLYETDHGHQPLYGTLAEWAMSVDSSDVWAERHFRSIGATPYHQAKAHERDALQLLLQSRQRCTEFSKAGGDFSWVRAIEETFGRHRPGDPPDEIHTSSSREAPPAYRAAFTAWAHDRLDSPGAIAWAVERLVPSRPVVSMMDASADTSAEADQRTVVKGFTPNELSDLKHIFDRTAAAWSASTRRFWSILLQVAEDRLQFEARRYASPILKRLQTAGTDPDPADAQRLALFLRPVATVEWARPGPVKGIEESASAGDPFALVSFSMGWRGHPNDREIAAALPAEPRWLTSLLRSLEAEIDRAYRLAGQIGWLGSRDRLSGTLRRVARDPSWWNGEEAGNGGLNDPDTYARPQRNLVRVTSAAWDCLATVDRDSARRIASGWGVRTESLFARLYLHTLRNPQVWDGDAVATVLSALDDAALWRGPDEVEVLLLARWQILPERAREAFEDRLRKGPPLDLHPAAATGEAEAWQRDRADRRLSVLEAAGGPLSAESRERVATYRARMATEAAADAADLSPRVSRAGWPEPGDASVVAGLAGAELLAAIDAHGTGRDGDWGAESPIGPLLQSDPERVLRALVDVDGGRGHGRLWNVLFRRLAFPETPDAVCDAAKETMLRAVVAMQDAPLADAASAVTDWLGGLVKGDDEATITFLVNHQDLVIEAWKRLAELALNGNEEVEAYGPDQGERLMMDALDSVAGALGFTGLVLADKGQRSPDRLPTLFGARGTIDARLQGIEGATRPLVAAQLADRLEIAASLLPEATEKLVLLPLTGDQVTDAGGLVLLDLFALYSLEMTPAIYRRLEPRLLEEVKAERLSARAVDNLVTMLTFRTLDRFAGVTDEAPTPDAMRKALQQTSESARAAAAVALENWLRAKPDADRAASWRGPGAMFFRTVWPLEAVLRTPAVSEALSQIPVVAGDAFPEAVNTIRPLLVPFTLWEMALVLLDRATAEAEIQADSEALNLSFEHWPAALTLVDAVVGPAPITVPYDLSIWLTYLADRTPEAANNPMFRRLQGLRHR